MLLSTTTAKIVLDYLQALVWPMVVCAALFYVRRPVALLLARMASESREVSAKGLGVEFAVKLVDEARPVGDLVEVTADPTSSRKSVNDAVAHIALSKFRALAANFFYIPLSERQDAAEEITRLAPALSTDDFLEFAKSSSGGERVGAAIGLGVLTGRSKQVRSDPRVTQAVRELLGDPSSLVRYRAVQATEACEGLASAVLPQLELIAADEENEAVRERAARAIAQHLDRTVGHISGKDALLEDLYRSK
jgi:hypothetical protein